MRASLGYDKVSKEKLAVAQKIREYVLGGGFMFAMCSATDSFDIALAAQSLDICEPMFDGDGSTPNYQAQLDYSKTFAFKDFILERDPKVYEFSSIDMTQRRQDSKRVRLLFAYGIFCEMGSHSNHAQSKSYSTCERVYGTNNSPILETKSSQMYWSWVKINPMEKRVTSMELKDKDFLRFMEVMIPKIIHIE